MDVSYLHTYHPKKYFYNSVYLIMDVCQMNYTFHNVLTVVYSLRYLAVVTALASEADFVFIPEAPPSVDWKDKLCDKLEQASLGSILLSLSYSSSVRVSYTTLSLLYSDSNIPLVFLQFSRHSVRKLLIVLFAKTQRLSIGKKKCVEK